MLAPLLAAALAYTPAPLPLATFDGEPSDKKWSVMNDPVMGGQSHSSLSMSEGFGSFRGKCAIVPFLHAPDFCQMSTTHGLFAEPNFKDASAYIDGALYLTVRSAEAYSGFKVSFTAKHAKRPGGGAIHHAGPSFKADFNVVPGSQFRTVRVPFSSFSVDWSEYTGKCDSKDPDGVQHHCCSPEHPEVCATAQHLSEITGISLWAEGVEGEFHLDVASIGAGPK